MFHENRLLTDDSYVILYLIFVENWERCLKIYRLLQSWLAFYGLKDMIFTIISVYDRSLADKGKIKSITVSHWTKEVPRGDLPV